VGTIAVGEVGNRRREAILRETATTLSPNTESAVITQVMLLWLQENFDFGDWHHTMEVTMFEGSSV